MYTKIKFKGTLDLSNRTFNTTIVPKGKREVIQFFF